VKMFDFTACLMGLHVSFVCMIGKWDNLWEICGRLH